MSVKDLYPSKSGYLKSEDLKGRAVKVTIEAASVVSFDNGQKLCLSFKGKEKKLTLNKTNAGILADSFGDDEDSWPGREIELYPDKTTYQGSLVDCVRVRVPVPAASDEDRIPF